MPKCELCDCANEEHLTDVAGKILCFGCEHEVMGWEHEHDALMWQLYGDE